MTSFFPSVIIHPSKGIRFAVFLAENRIIDSVSVRLDFLVRLNPSEMSLVTSCSLFIPFAYLYDNCRQFYNLVVQFLPLLSDANALLATELSNYEI